MPTTTTPDSGRCGEPEEVVRARCRAARRCEEGGRRRGGSRRVRRDGSPRRRAGGTSTCVPRSRGRLRRTWSAHAGALRRSSPARRTHDQAGTGPGRLDDASRAGERDDGATAVGSAKGDVGGHVAGNRVDVTSRPSGVITTIPSAMAPTTIRPSSSTASESKEYGVAATQTPP